MKCKISVGVAASVAELKKDPINTVAAGGGFPVAILDHNVPVFYCIPTKAYEDLLDRLEDLELNALVNARKGQKRIRVSL
jgi:antitoxin StbD